MSKKGRSKKDQRYRICEICRDPRHITVPVFIELAYGKEDDPEAWKKSRDARNARFWLFGWNYAVAAFEKFGRYAPGKVPSHRVRARAYIECQKQRIHANRIELQFHASEGYLAFFMYKGDMERAAKRTRNLEESPEGCPKDRDGRQNRNIGTGHSNARPGTGGGVENRRMGEGDPVASVADSEGEDAAEQAPSDPQRGSGAAPHAAGRTADAERPVKPRPWRSRIESHVRE